MYSEFFQSRQGRIVSACGKEEEGRGECGVSWVPLLLFSSGMRQMQQTCSPGPAWPDKAGQTKPQAALERTVCRRGGEGEREEREEGTTGATPRPSRSCHCSLSAKCRAQLWAGLIAATRLARGGEGHVDSLLIRMFPDCLGYGQQAAATATTTTTTTDVGRSHFHFQGP